MSRRGLRAGFSLAGTGFLIALLAACGTLPRYSAASDIHAFLAAVRDGDRAGFEAHVDRRALKLQLRSRVIAQAGGSAEGGSDLSAVGAVLAGPLVDLAVDAFVRPEVFRAEAIRLGYDPAQPLPNALAIASRVRPLGEGRVCVTTVRAGPCVFDFDDEDGVWRLTGYEGPLTRPPRAPQTPR